MDLRRITSKPRQPASPRPANPKRELALMLGRLIGLAIVILIAVLIARYCSPEADLHFKVADRTTAIDGDTLRSGDVEVRLFSVDAPELGQTCTASDGKDWECGREAQRRLKALIGRYAVDCTPRGRDNFSRVVAICGTSKVPDLGEALVREGLAVNLDGRGQGHYRDAELSAEAAKRGLWQGSFERPSDWRLQHPRQ